ncbi:phosphoesterase, partial [Francisella tularensis subsp. holarctica]|nr:phosphoesterase [Francisella tularensis subsp. holarctica]
MNYFDHKLEKTTAIYGFLTLIIAILSYNFLDINFATLVHSSELFGTGVGSIGA